MTTKELIARAEAVYREYDETGRGLVAVAAIAPDLIAALRAAEARADAAQSTMRGQTFTVNDAAEWEARAERAEATLADAAQREQEVCLRMVAAAYQDAVRVAQGGTLPCDVGGSLVLDPYTAETIAAAILARTPADAQAALDKLIHEAEARGQAKAGAIFATSGAEARYVEDGENACPACNGSGHKGDATRRPRAGRCSSEH